MLARLTNIRQQNQETLLGYMKKLKQLRYIVKIQIGKKILEEMMERQQICKNASMTEQIEMKMMSFEIWPANLFLKSSDQTKYESLVKGLSTQFSLWNNQFSKIFTAATGVLTMKKRKKTHERNTNRK